MDLHPSRRVDEVAHQRVRLGVLALLSRRERISFTDLRDTLGQSDGGLGRHLRVLEEAGYLLVEKRFENRRPRTSFSLSGAGRAAIEAETRALTDLIGELPAVTGPAPFIAPLGGGRGTSAGPGRYTDLILRQAYAGLSVTAEGPLGDGYTAPPGFGRWPGQEEQRMTFLSHGLKGGHVRRWARAEGSGAADGSAAAGVLLVELRDDAAPPAVLSALAEPTMYVPLLPAVRGYRLGDPPASCVVWLAQGPFLACVSVSDSAEVVENRAVVLAQTQFMKLKGTRPAGGRPGGAAPGGRPEAAGPAEEPRIGARA